MCIRRRKFPSLTRIRDAALITVPKIQNGRNKKRARQFEITMCKGPIEFIRAVTCILAKYNPRTEELP